MKLPSRLRFIYACIFLDAVGIGLIIPVLPRLIGVLTDTRDEQMWWYGTIMLSYGVMQFLASPLLGALSDRIGRRPVLLSGICGLGIMFAVPAVSTSLTAILASRILGGLLSANISVAQAYIADVTTGYERAAAFGRIGAVFGAGFLVGPALGGLLGGNDPQIPFIVASVVSLLNFGYGLLVLPESLAQRSTEPISLRKNNAFGSLAHLLKLPQIRVFVLTLALFSLANSLMQYSWALYTEFRYGFTPREIGLTIFGLSLGIAVVQGYCLQRLLLYISPVKLTLTSLGLGVGLLIGVALSPTGLIASLCFCLYALSASVTPLLSGTVSRRMPMSVQGATMGTVSSVHSLMGAIAPAFTTPMLMVAGHHADDPLAGLPFFGAAALCLCALAVFAAASRKLLAEERRETEDFLED